MWSNYSLGPLNAVKQSYLDADEIMKYEITQTIPSTQWTFAVMWSAQSLIIISKQYCTTDLNFIKTELSTRESFTDKESWTMINYYWKILCHWYS